MADPVWGQLAKAQDDAETIEEAIARLIAEHESDAGAHTGAGESLETHKSQEIVDHPAGSILADKGTITEEIFRTNFEDPFLYASPANISQNDVPGFYIGIIGIDEKWRAVMSADQDPYYLYTYLTLNWMWQTTVFFSGDEVDFVFGITSRGGAGEYDGAYFRRTSGVLRGYWSQPAGTVSTDPITIPATNQHIFRLQYVAAEKLLYFYINGVKVATLDLSGFTGGTGAVFCYDVFDDAEGELEGGMYVREMIMARERD